VWGERKIAIFLSGRRGFVHDRTYSKGAEITEEQSRDHRGKEGRHITLITGREVKKIVSWAETDKITNARGGTSKEGAARSSRVLSFGRR